MGFRATGPGEQFGDGEEGAEGGEDEGRETPGGGGGCVCWFGLWEGVEGSQVCEG